MTDEELRVILAILAKLSLQVLAATNLTPKAGNLSTVAYTTDTAVLDNLALD